MELDERMKAFEHELKSLKNEIQRTLLDIQEQVLMHYYPTLRVEDTTPPVDAVAQPSRARPAVITKKVSPDDL